MEEAKSVYVQTYYPDCKCAVSTTYAKSKNYVITSEEFGDLSVTCFSEEEAWQDAAERISGKRPMPLKYKGE